MQTRVQSMLEQIANVASGFVVSFAFWTYVVVPVWNLPVQAAENLQITAAFTALSIARGYIWRRIFNRIHGRQAMSPRHTCPACHWTGILAETMTLDDGGKKTGPLCPMCLNTTQEEQQLNTGEHLLIRRPPYFEESK